MTTPQWPVHLGLKGQSNQFRGRLTMHVIGAVSLAALIICFFYISILFQYEHIGFTDGIVKS
jgi:hypothetical protein